MLAIGEVFFLEGGLVLETAVLLLVFVLLFSKRSFVVCLDVVDVSFKVGNLLSEVSFSL